MSGEFRISSLLSRFEESATLALAGRAKKMISDGRDVINFSAGEPDFVTPEAILRAGYEAGKKGATKYTAVGGAPSLRAAIARRLSADYDLDFQADQVLVSNGGKQSIFHAFQAVLEPGDEVLVPSPYWTSFPEMLKIVGAKPVIVNPEGARLSPRDIEKSLSPRTRMIILNSPSNPSGVVWTRDELSSFLKVLKPHPIWVMSDDTYYNLVFPPHQWVSILKIDPGFTDRSIIIGSMSKSYAMTGLRLGWALAPKDITNAMIKLQGQVTSGASSITQAAAEEALGPENHWAAEFRKIFAIRRALVGGLLKGIPGIQFAEPEGAFYYFVDVSKALKGERVSAFCERALEKYGVCVVPGEAFGMPNFIRLTYASGEEELKEGIVRLSKALSAPA